MRRIIVGAVLATLVLAGLVGCSDALLRPTAPPAPKDPPAVVTETQSQRVLGKIGAALKKVSSTRTINPISSRITGPAETMLKSELAMHQADESYTLTQLGDSFSSDMVIVEASQSWPRFFLAVTNQKDGRANFLYVIVQNSAREDYKLWGWTQLIPGTQLPATALPETGSPALKLDAKNLKVSPKKALEEYAQAFPTDQTPGFGADDRNQPRESFRAAVSAVSEPAPGAPAPTVQATTTVVPKTGFVVQTAEFGAIVIGQLESHLSVTVPEGRLTFTLPQTYSAFLGDQRSSPRGGQIDYTGVVAIGIPEKGSDEPARVLGISHRESGASLL